MLRFVPIILLASLLSINCGSTGKDCTAAGCVSGVSVDFELRERGNYVFDVTVDGVKTRCTATLPLSNTSSPPCDAPGILLILSGSALPESEQLIGGLSLTTTTAKSITIVATRDGEQIGESTVAPPYQVGPPPNGPDCEPAGCTFARYSFP